MGMNLQSRDVQVTAEVSPSRLCSPTKYPWSSRSNSTSSSASSMEMKEACLSSGTRSSFGLLLLELWLPGPVEPYEGTLSRGLLLISSNSAGGDAEVDAMGMMGVLDEGLASVMVIKG